MKQELLVPGDDTWDRENEAPPQTFDLWTRANVGENLPFPITPLTETNFPRLFGLVAKSSSGEAQFQGVRRFYGRLYINEGALLHDIEEKYGIPATLIDKLWGSRSREGQQRKSKFRPLRLIRKLPALLRQGTQAMKQAGPKHTPAQFFAQVDQWVNASLQQDFSVLDDAALWQQGLPLWSERGAYAFSTNIRISMPSAFLYATLQWLVNKWTGQKEIAQELVAGLPGIFSAEVGPALWNMAETLREHDLSAMLQARTAIDAATLAQLRTHAEAQQFFEQLGEFLRRHGHRCPNELELLNPRWSEAPEQVLHLVVNYMQAGEAINPVIAEKRQRQRRAQALTAVNAKLGLIRRFIVHFMLKKAQRAVTIRDNSRYYMTKLIFPMRKLYAQLGQRWVERGWLQQPDDIFFLTVTEIEQIIHAGAPESSQALQRCVANRRIAYEYWMHTIAPDAIGADGEPLRETAQKMHTLTGTPASGGQVRGRARLVQDVQSAMALTREDILVTRATDPGWTPIFPLVGGVVLEIGGQLSHGAIVAREYGIPAIVNVRGAMQTIRDGQMITVDGTTGYITLSDE